MSKISRDKKKNNPSNIANNAIDSFVEDINFGFVTQDHEFGEIGSFIPKIIKINNDNTFECAMKDGSKFILKISFQN